MAGWGDYNFSDDTWGGGRQAGLSAAFSALAKLDPNAPFYQKVLAGSAGFGSGQQGFLSDYLKREQDEEEQQAIQEQRRMQTERYKRQDDHEIAVAQKEKDLETALRGELEKRGVEVMPGSSLEMIAAQVKSEQQKEAAAAEKERIASEYGKAGIPYTGIPGLDAIQQKEFTREPDTLTPLQQYQIDRQESAENAKAGHLYSQLPPEIQARVPTPWGNDRSAVELISLYESVLKQAAPKEPSFSEIVGAQATGNQDIDKALIMERIRTGEMTGRASQQPAAPPAPPAPKPRPISSVAAAGVVAPTRGPAPVSTVKPNSAALSEAGVTDLISAMGVSPDALKTIPPRALEQIRVAWAAGNTKERQQLIETIREILAAGGWAGR